MKKLFTCLLALALSACASIQNPVNTTYLADVESAYGLALSAAVAYRSLPLCQANEKISLNNICAKRSVILQLQAADRKAVAAITAANNFVRDNPTLNAVSLVTAASDAVSTFKQVETNNGVAQ